MSTTTTDTPVLDLLTSMTTDSLEASSLEADELVLVRLAALVAVGAPAGSYFASMGVMDELDVDSAHVRGVLAAVAPIVGTARVVEATGNIMRALGIAIEASDLLDDESDEDAESN
jgi:hypothetical protein